MAEAKDTATKAVENTAAVIQKATDEAEANGYYGERTDETPLSEYTVAGVTKKSK